MMTSAESINIVMPSTRPSSTRAASRLTTTTGRVRTAQTRSRTASVQSRPWTAAQSRPTTARPQTAASVKQESSYIIALLEGRGIAREVGMAALDRDTGKVMLVQVFLHYFAFEFQVL
jgi:DNA mismatch repair protein MSH4